MDDDEFSIHLMRLIAAQLHTSTTLQVARDLFGKSFYSLGFQEQQLAEQQAFQHIGWNYNALKPELFRSQGFQQPVGFGGHQTSQPKSES